MALDGQQQGVVGVEILLIHPQQELQTGYNHRIYIKSHKKLLLVTCVLLAGHVHHLCQLHLHPGDQVAAVLRPTLPAPALVSRCVDPGLLPPVAGVGQGGLGGPHPAPALLPAPALEAEPAPVVPVRCQPLLEAAALEAAHLHTHIGSTVKLSVS